MIQFEYPDYTDLALRTTPDKTPNQRTRDIEITGEQKQLLLGAIGLSGESGEIAELVKKHVFHGHSINKEKFIKELGDVLWYLNYLTVRCADLTLLDVMRANITKLSARYPEGFFSAERSMHRVAGDD